MEHAMDRAREWDSYGQMEPSSANYSPVQLIPMVTQMKGRALCTSSCSFSIPIFLYGNVLHFPELLPQKWHLGEMVESLCGKTELKGYQKRKKKKNITDEMI